MDRHLDLMEIYAGVECNGAADAAYATAIEIEYCRVTGKQYTGGAADIYKCFDQIRRPIVYKLLEAAGMPRQVVHAYRSFLEALSVKNRWLGAWVRNTPSQHPFLKVTLFR